VAFPWSNRVSRQTRQSDNNAQKEHTLRSSSFWTVVVWQCRETQRCLSVSRSSACWRRRKQVNIGRASAECGDGDVYGPLSSQLLCQESLSTSHRAVPLTDGVDAGWNLDLCLLAGVVEGLDGRRRVGRRGSRHG
jgi:hypothetical protein